MDGYESVVERIVSTGGVTVLLGGLDSGKSSFGRAVAEAGLQAGLTVGFLDADVAQKTVGPPATVSLRVLRQPPDLAPESFSTPDAIYFVGTTSPQGHLLPITSGSARLLARAWDEGADLVVVDTNSVVSGVYGQLLHYHKIELLQPDLVVGLQRGGELEPLLGIVQRFFAMDILALPLHPRATPTSVDERAQNREVAMRRYFSVPLQRWRVKPTVFMPALPALFEQSQLDRVVVGLSDGKGEYTGLGYLEYGDGVLRLISPVGEAPKGLKLGSMRLDDDFRVRRLDLRNLFGTD